MADLIVEGSEMNVSEWRTAADGLRLYCWPCQAVHEMAVPDVERIIYALGADAAGAWDDEHMPSGSAVPECLETVRLWAADADVYGKHVEQGVERRTAAP